MSEEPTTEEEVAVQQRAEIFQALSEAYSAQLDDQMGLLYNQFVAFISSASLPLPQVLLVLEMLAQETIVQARAKYTGG